MNGGIKSLKPVEKLIFLRLIKNAQMQVESAKSRLRGRPKSFWRERFQTVPYDYDAHCNKPDMGEG